MNKNKAANKETKNSILSGLILIALTKVPIKEKRNIEIIINTTPFRCLFMLIHQDIHTKRKDSLINLMLK